MDWKKEMISWQKVKNDRRSGTHFTTYILVLVTEGGVTRILTHLWHKTEKGSTETWNSSSYDMRIDMKEIRKYISKSSITESNQGDLLS